MEDFQAIWRAARPLALLSAACAPSPELCDTARYPPQVDSAYNLPYPTGQTHNVRQGNCVVGNTHNAAHHASFAYDFEMPIGSEVSAARAGRVVEVQASHADTDHDPDHGNYILVRHDDASYAIYGHLSPIGLGAGVGDAVAQGQILARSGDSGLSRGPHLHFAVLRCGLVMGPLRLWCETVPTTFRNTAPHPRGLEGSPTSEIGGGRRYTAERVP